jgi:hypothetical protein
MRILLALVLALSVASGAQAQSGTRGAVSQGSGMRSAPAPSAPSSYQNLAPSNSSSYSSPAPVGQITEGSIVHESMPMQGSQQGTIVHSSSSCQGSTVYYGPTYSSAPVYSSPIVTGPVYSAPAYSAPSYSYPSYPSYGQSSCSGGQCHSW